MPSLKADFFVDMIPEEIIERSRKPTPSSESICEILYFFYMSDWMEAVWFVMIWLCFIVGKLLLIIGCSDFLEVWLLFNIVEWLFPTHKKIFKVENNLLLTSGKER